MHGVISRDGGNVGEQFSNAQSCQEFWKVHVYAATYPDVYSNQRRGLYVRITRSADKSTESYNNPNYPYHQKLAISL